MSSQLTSDACIICYSRSKSDEPWRIIVRVCPGTLCRWVLASKPLLCESAISCGVTSLPTVFLSLSGGEVGETILGRHNLDCG